MQAINLFWARLDRVYRYSRMLKSQEISYFLLNFYKGFYKGFQKNKIRQKIIRYLIIFCVSTYVFSLLSKVSINLFLEFVTPRDYIPK